MKYLTLILIFISSLGFSQDNFIVSSPESNLQFFNLVKEYRDSLNCDDAFLFDTTGCDIILEKSKWYASKNSCGHNVDPNRSWSKCENNALDLVNTDSVKWSNKGKFEIAQYMPLIIPNGEDPVEYTRAYMNSDKFWKDVLNGFKTSPAHAGIISDNVPSNYWARSKEYKYFMTCAASVDIDNSINESKIIEGVYTSHIVIHSTFIRVGHGYKYHNCHHGNVICESTEDPTGKVYECDQCFKPKKKKFFGLF